MGEAAALRKLAGGKFLAYCARRRVSERNRRNAAALSAEMPGQLCWPGGTDSPQPDGGTASQSPPYGGDSSPKGGAKGGRGGPGSRLAAEPRDNGRAQKKPPFRRQ